MKFFKSKQFFALSIILAIAIFFRFYLIDSMPGGLFPDEAANGLDINLMEQGQLQPFYERGNGREALFFYMIWGAVKFMGRTATAHHLVSALVGTISVGLAWLVTRRLWSVNLDASLVTPKTFFGASGALVIAPLAAFFMATSAWHTVLSRTAFRANLIPLFASLSIFFFLGMLISQSKKARYINAIFFGLSFAGGFYTYIAFRILALLFPILAAWVLISQATKHRLWATLKSWIGPIIISILFFTIAIAPLAHYFYTHEGSFVGRSGQVSVFNPNLNQGDLPGTILEVTRKSLLAYVKDGDLNWRHNISGLPFLPPMLSPLFLLGIIVSTVLAAAFFFRPGKFSQHLPHFVLSLWWWSMLVPVVTTAEGIPHGLRAIGTIPAVFIYTAYGTWLVLLGMQKVYLSALKWQSRPQEKMVRVAAYILAFTFVLSHPAYTYTKYFILAYNSPEYFYAFRSDLTPVSNYLLTNGAKHNTYLVLDKFSVQTVDYFTTTVGRERENPRNQPYVQVDPEDSDLLEQDLKDNKPVWTFGLPSGTKVVFTQSSIFDIAKFKESHPNSKKITEERNKFGQAVLAVYEIE